jgi:hypothetical protein
MTLQGVAVSLGAFEWFRAARQRAAGARADVIVQDYLDSLEQAKMHGGGNAREIAAHHRRTLARAVRDGRLRYGHDGSTVMLPDFAMVVKAASDPE